MAMHKNTVKRVKLEHDICEDPRLSFIIVPIGFKYNLELQELNKGDIIVFLGGSEHYVEDAVKLPLKSAIANALCRLRYNIGIDKAIDIWTQRLKMRREKVKAMSDKECLVIFYHKKEVEYVRKQEI